VLALSTNAHLQLKDLIGQPVRLDLLTQQSRTQLRPFHGHVTSFSLVGSDGGLARYRLVIESWLSFLAHRQDAWVFQDQTVMQIIDELFADYQGQGQLAPAWRWDLADASLYAKRSLCIQYAESDLDFVQRLLAEEGLFCWFEHQADDGDTLGQHTLVIADHNGGFQPNVQPQVRFTQSGSSFSEDSLTLFDEQRGLGPSILSIASYDHRNVQQASSTAAGDVRLSPNELSLTTRDQPGAYAYEDSAQAQRLAERQLQALQAPAYQSEGQGSLRQAACATTFSLSEHPSADAATRYVFLRVQHRARNNITAELHTGLAALLGAVPQSFAQPDNASGQTKPAKPTLFKGPLNQSEEPLYQASITVQDAAIPVRAPSRACINLQGDIVFTRPQVPGQQTAIVVGMGEPIHTDRDGRIKVQFHWQRGDNASHRLSHVAGSNAPGNHGAGTWVRVSQAWAGANWGAQHTPRLGQEVVVTFTEGDIDRPVVTGSAYNGQGQADAQGNQIATGAATSTGNAGAWFPGNQKAGPLEGHAHNAVLSGFKSQSLDTSQSGSGGHNQLVLDDTPAQARVTLGSTQAQTWLQLGHLLQQTDNQRLAKRGHGIDLTTGSQGAVRAGSGLHLSAYTLNQGSAASAQSVEARAAIAQIGQAGELTQTLTETAQKHQAKLSAEAEPQQLPSRKGQRATVDSLSATDSRGAVERADREQEDFIAIQGGAGTVAAWSRPDLLISAPGGIASATPAHSVYSAGTTASLSAGQDINLASQRHSAWAVKGGISLFTYGKAQDPNKPNQEAGIQLHAASGNVSVQAQANTLELTADKAVNVASTSDAITMGSPEHVLLNGGGSSIKITTGSITITTSGPANFMAAMKNLTGAGSASASLSLPKAGQFYDEQFVVKDEKTGEPMAFLPYRVENSQGDVIAQGLTDEQGQVRRVSGSKSEKLKLFY
ncbi:MAG TPA: type VI secretion system tip protein TssI/VgrG, partial [Rhizobacter sp.]|nr:type VI secretion system tip protein TssI/VgrG [Rhizobacter sp.]